MHRCILLFTSLLLSGAGYAQIPYADSKELLLKGVEHYKEGNYKKAIEQFAAVHECDTNYALAVYETGLSYQADTAYRAALDMAKHGLAARSANKRELMLLLAANYDYLKKHDSAHMVYDSLIRLYPHDNQALYEKGVVWFKQEGYDKALYYFQRSLVVNPGHFRSHYMAGMTYALQGRLSEALIALEASMLVTQNSDLAKQSVTVINNITEGTEEVSKMYRAKKEQYSHPLFDEIDELINSKVALDKKYKLLIGLNDNVFRQSQVVMEKLKYNATDTNFVMQYYVPMLTNIFEKELFESYMLLVFSGFGYDNVNELAKKKSAGIAAVKQEVFPYLTHIQSTRELNYRKREKAEELYHFYTNENLIAIGKVEKQGSENAYVGNITFLNSGHTLLSSGRYNDKGKREGWWISYYASGIPKFRQFYREGEERDSAYYFYANGNPRKIHLLDEKGAVKEEYEYDASGWLSAIRKRLSEKSVEEQTFFSNGRRQMMLTYKDGDIVDGDYTIYHKNGKVKQQLTMKDGKTHGAYKSYFDNGKLNQDAIYVKGELNGPYFEYFLSGAMKDKATYENGKLEGAFEEYHDNGRLAERGEYRRGVKITVRKYSRKGKLYAMEENRSSGLPESLIFLNEDSAVVYKKEDRKGLNEYELYYADGTRHAEMRLNDKGNKHGTINVYYNTGIRSIEANYEDGNLEGMYRVYYYDGQKMNEVNYTAGARDGYYRAYFGNGVLQMEGWYKADVKQGLWKYYHINGMLKNEAYYLNDVYDGWYKEYDINGTLANKYFFEKGVSSGQVCYDTSGVRTDSTMFRSASEHVKLTHWQLAPKFTDLEYDLKYYGATGKCLLRYLGGKLKEDNNYVAGNKDSLCIEYFPNGAVSSKGSYTEGNKEGRWVHYNDAGEMVIDGKYTDGNIDGRYLVMAGNRVFAEYNYVNGSKQGAQISYGDEGRAALVLYYDEGDLTGYSYEGKDGKLLPEIPIKRGSAKVVALYSNGQKAAEVEIKNHLIKGKMTVYYSNGNIAEERSCNSVGLDGPMKRYTADGKLLYEGYYKDGECHGQEKTWDRAGKLLISAGYYYGERHGPTIVTEAGSGTTKTYNYNYGIFTGAN